MGENLSDKTKEVPDKPGVFYIMRLAEENVDLVYMGKSSVRQQGKDFMMSTLRETLTDKELATDFLAFIDEKMVTENIDALDIYWTVTHDRKIRDLPGYAYSIMTLNYYDVHRHIPPWNDSF